MAKARTTTGDSGGFVHLHTHTHYSLLDGIIRLGDLAEKAARLRMGAVAMTDHGNMCGAVEFYKTMIKAGIRPIIGLEAYVSPISIYSDEKPADHHHLTLLAKNNAGYTNLMKLSTISFIDGFYKKPRVDDDILARHADGIIALSGCMSGRIPRLLMAGRRDDAEEAAGKYADMFGQDNFFIEMQNHRLPEQVELLPKLARLAADLALGTVATNDCHYLEKEDAVVQEVAMAIATNHKITDPDRMRLSSEHFYFKTADEMRVAFADYPEAFAATLEIAERSGAVTMDFESKHLPKFAPPDGLTVEDFFRTLCERGLKGRYGAIEGRVKERFDFEFNIIKDQGFIDYFLIVWDFIKFARESGIPVGPGRGSSAGSIIAYALRITDLDPLKYGLIFERFLNPERTALPDIDIDFCRDRRAEVIEYVQSKYGRENTAAIIAFNSLKAKAAIKDVGRALDVSYMTTDELTKLVPQGLDVDIDAALDQEPELARRYADDGEIKRLIDIARRIQGINRNPSRHAAGIVICDEKITEYCPLQTVDKEIATQYAMGPVAEIGLLKIDFLGLKTLTLIKNTIAMVRETRGVEADFDSAELRDMDDRATYKLLHTGNTHGVFQLESDGMQQLVRSLAPDAFEQIIPLVGLYRPGPLSSGMTEEFVHRKRGESEVTYEVPGLEPVLSTTFGTIVYQEQVMRIASDLAGFSMADADKLRKAMGKKDPELLESFKSQFVEGAEKNKIESSTATRLFEQILHFAGYGFPKSHAAAYAVLTYRTAFLKARYPEEFMASLMSLDKGDSAKAKAHIAECQRAEIKVEPPEVASSAVDFTVEDGTIKFGLCSVSGVGEKAAEAIVEARDAEGPFRSYFDFFTRVDLRAANRKVVENLVKAGAFDSFGHTRAAMLAGAEKGLAIGARALDDRRSGQKSIFEAMSGPVEAPEDDLPDVPEMSREEFLAAEKETLGFYRTDHPLRMHLKEIRSLSNISLAELPGKKSGDSLTVGVLITGVSQRKSKRGLPYCVFEAEDLTGSARVFVFHSKYDEYRPLIAPEKVVFITGTADTGGNDGGTAIITDRMVPIEKAVERLAARVIINLPVAGVAEELAGRIAELCRAHPGRCPVFLRFRSADNVVTTVKAGAGYSVAPTPDFFEDAAAIVGEEALKYEGNS